MATSGSTDFSVSRDDIITESMQICKVLGEGGTPSANQLTDWSRTLNMLVKFLSTKGLQLWAIEKLVLFPVKNQAEYTLGSSGDRMCLTSELIQTELDGDHSANATVLTVAGKDGTTGMASADVIGVQTDSNDIHWTTINGSPTSTSITITTGLSGAAADNKNVYTYTTVFAQKLLRIQNMWRQTDSGLDIPIGMISRQGYIDLSDKTSNGPANQAYYDPRLDTGILSIWQVPSDSETDELLFIRGSRLFEDFDSAANTPDFPQEWYLPITYKLAELRAPHSGVTGIEFKEIAMLAEKHMKEAEDFDAETGSLFLVPDDVQSSYRR